MILNEEDIKSYLVNYFNFMFKQKISIDISDGCYVVNKSKKYNIYKFWNKESSELLNDFMDCSFQNDYLGTIFFFLSGYWEYIHSNKKDAYGRFIGKDSFSFKKQVIEKPVVDILVNKLAEELKLDYSYNNSKPKLFITHDIDYLSMIYGINFILSIAVSILKERNIKNVFLYLINRIYNNDPYSVINLVNVHKKYNTKGTYFFLPSIQKLKDSVGLGYSLKANKKILKRYKEAINDTKGDIGIHYSSRHLREKQMSKDIKSLETVLNQKISSGRSHFLIFDIKRSFKVYEESGLKLDTTCSYADMVGFRFGTCRPFRPYNFATRKEYNILEVPLIVMEGCLQGPKKMNLNPEDGFNRIKKLINIVDEYNGVFTFLWHNTSFYTNKWNNWEWILEETIKYGLKKGLKTVNAKELIKSYEEFYD